MYMVGYNKPCIVEVEGDLFNAGAAIFYQMPWVNRSAPSRAIFNEAQRNATLLGGSSYLLSRMPHGLGKYIALTGIPIEGSDLQQLGLVTLNMELDRATLSAMEEKMVHLPRFREYRTLFTIPQVKKIRDEILREENYDKYIDQQLDERLKAQPGNAYNVLRDTIARTLITKHANQVEQVSQTGNWAPKYRSIKDSGILQTVENRMGTVEQFVLRPAMAKQGKYSEPITTEPGYLTSHLTDAAKYFGDGSFETILNSLDKLDSEWANKAKARLSKLDPAVANRIIKQIDFAVQNDYVSCLVNEYEVAMEYLAGDKAGIKDYELSYNFRSPPRAILPIKEYYLEYPDAVRMALNNTYNCDPFVHKNFGRTVRTVLNLQGIDILNPVTTMDVVREVLWNRKKLERDTALAKEKRELLFGNFEMRNKYAEERRHSIDTLFESPEVTHKINEVVSEAFNKKLEDHRKYMAYKNQAAQLLMRRDNLDKLRTVITNIKLTPLVSDLKSKFVTVPLEIVDDPLAYNPQIAAKYYLEERADLLNAKLDLNRANVEAYLRGDASVHNLLHVALNAKDDSKVGTENYFRDHFIVWREADELKVKRQFRDRLAIQGLEDLRELEFRERYLDEQATLVMEQLDNSKKFDISQRKQAFTQIRQTLKDDLFDYFQGVTNKFFYEDPHTAIKPEVMDARDVVKVLHGIRENKFTFKEDLADINQKIMDIPFSTSYSKVTPEMESPGSNSLVSLLKESIEFNEDLNAKIGRYLDNPNFAHFLIGHANKNLNQKFLQHLAKAAQNQGKYLGLNPEDEQKINSTGMPVLEGGSLDDPMFAGIDTYIMSNLALINMERILPVALVGFTSEAIAFLGTLLRITQGLTSKAEIPPMIKEHDKQVLIQQQNRIRIGVAKLLKLNHNEDIKLPTPSAAWYEVFTNFIKNEITHLIKIGKEATEQITDTAAVKQLQPTITELRNAYESIDWYQVDNYLHTVKRNKPRGILDPTQEEIAKSKIIEALRTDPRSPGFEKAMKQYGEWRAIYTKEERYLIGGATTIIFEVESILKKINEGRFSGVDEDFSSLNSMLETNFLTTGQNGDSWVKSRLLEYFETLFAIRSKFEKDLNNKDLIEYDFKFAEFFTPTSLRQMLVSELERDMAAFDFIRELHKAKENRDSDLIKYEKNPELMAFTLKHRIVNTVAFKHYRTFFMMAQVILSSTGDKKRVDLRRLKLEEEILKVTMERLFKASQTSANNLPVARPFDIVGSAQLRSPINIDVEGDFDRYDVNLIKSLGNSQHRKVFSHTISEEMDKLKERMRIYGYN